MRIFIAGGIALSAAITNPAHASCDFLGLSNQSEDVILGEIGTISCPTSGCYFEPFNRPTLGACWRGPDGEWHIQMLSCDSLTPADQNPVLFTFGGDDRVAVLRREHTKGDRKLLPTKDGFGAMRCGNTGTAIAPWHKDFRFGLDVYLGEGTDLFHGTDNADGAWTNAPVFAGGIWTSHKDSSTPDMVCTYGGNDTIYGDGDDAYTSGTEDWMDGGTGIDLCDGDYGHDGSDISDLHRGCEVAYDAYPDLPYVDAIHCEDSDDPLHEW